MRMNRALSLFAILLPILTLGQKITYPDWTWTASKTNPKVGEVIEIVLKTTNIPKNWYIYSNDFTVEGPNPAYFEFTKDKSWTAVSKVPYPIGAEKHYDDIWKGDVSIFTHNNAEFRFKIRVNSCPFTVKGYCEYQMCTTVDGKCVQGDFDFTVTGSCTTAETDSKTSVPIDSAKTEANTPAPEINQERTDTPSQTPVQPVLTSAPPSKAETDDLWSIILQAFLAGLAAIIMPCVFPMIPMTVSYFTKQSHSRSEGVKKGLIYGFSIVAIYTIPVLGLAAAIGDPDFFHEASTHWGPNLFFFIIFMVFAASFFGMFEINLPSSWITRMDKQASKGGNMGIFFMAFTLVLASFACTVGLIGNLIPLLLSGTLLKPVVGMLVFSGTLALPFTFFAIFPSWLKSLPRSGGWLNSVKVCLGFIEVAAAFKFLSVADQTYHWHILDREVYLAIWIVNFFLMGLYLLGKLKFAHDSDLPFISVPRLAFAIAVFAFTVYMIPGMWGAPLKALAGYLPPQSSMDFNLNERRGGGDQQTPDFPKVKYSDFLHLPHQLQGFYDFKEAAEYSKKVNKPIFIDFTGHGCVNCREMEARVWSDPAVLSILRNDYVVVALYTDDKTTLPENEWYTSPYDNKVKKTMGKQNADFQLRKFNANAQPYYCLVDADANLLTGTAPEAYNLDVAHFVQFLQGGLDAWKKRSAHP